MIIQFTDSKNTTYYIHTNKIEFMEIYKLGNIDVFFSKYIVQIEKIDAERFMQLYKRSIDTQILTEAK